MAWIVSHSVVQLATWVAMLAGIAGLISAPPGGARRS